jgi:hypothetical protein
VWSGERRKLPSSPFYWRRVCFAIAFPFSFGVCSVLTLPTDHVGGATLAVRCQEKPSLGM